jgi:hypothetical protein
MKNILKCIFLFSGQSGVIGKDLILCFGRHETDHRKRKVYNKTKKRNLLLTLDENFHPDSFTQQNSHF